MAEITVRAIDSALAMEEVQKRLGDDALIISTKRIDGQIEITATEEEVIKPEKEIKPLILSDIYRQDNFSAVLDRKVGEAESDTDRNASSDLYSEVTNKISKINALNFFILVKSDLTLLNNGIWDIVNCPNLSSDKLYCFNAS